jgi:hypothetical protein
LQILTDTSPESLPRRIIYRRFVAAKTISLGRFEPEVFSTVFEELAKKVVEIAQHNESLDKDVELNIINDEENLYFENPELYQEMLKEIENKSSARSESVDSEQKSRADDRPSFPVKDSAISPEVQSSTRPLPQSSSEGSSVAVPQSDGSQSAATGSPSLRTWASYLLAGAVLLSSAAWLFGFAGWSCGVIRKSCYDSGWVEIDNARTRAWPFDHGMSFTPTSVEILFWPPGEQERWYPVNIGKDLAGNPINVSVTSSQVILDVYSGSPMRNIFDAERVQWQAYAKGRFRILAR